MPRFHEGDNLQRDYHGSNRDNRSPEPDAIERGCGLRHTHMRLWSPAIAFTETTGAMWRLPFGSRCAWARVK
jgi:hypothetical protein